MTPDDIRSAYILYIGAGAVAAGGIISLLRSLPTIWSSLLRRAEGLPRRRARHGRRRIRTDRDLSMKVVLVGSLGAGHRDHARAAAAHEPGRRQPDRRPRVPVRHRVVAADRRDRLLVESDLRHDGRDAAADLPRLPDARLDRAVVLRHGAVGRRDRLHRLVERRHDVAGSEDRIPGRRDAATTSRSRSSSARCSRPLAARPDPAPAQRRRDRLRAAHQQGAGRRRHRRRAARRREFSGHAARRSRDADATGRPTRARSTCVWHKQSIDDGPAGKYLVDASGTPVYLVDPGINGMHRVHAGRAAPGGEVRRARRRR